MRTVRCSANEAVSSGPNGRGRRSGSAIGDRPGAPTGKRTSLRVRPIRYAAPSLGSTACAVVVIHALYRRR